MYRGATGQRDVLLRPHLSAADSADSSHDNGFDTEFLDLCDSVFASMPRSDQRRKALEYVHGLLTTPGRKSIRNIATSLGGQATEQSLHHFVSNSTWDWTCVLSALADYLVQRTAPEAWVMRPIVIPKAGKFSVGVDRRYFPALGRVCNAQQAVGLWLASAQASCPVNWRLQLPSVWLKDEGTRSLASIPKTMVAESLDDCAVQVYREIEAPRAARRLPVVMDGRNTDTLAVIRKLWATGAPMVVRCTNAAQLVVADPALRRDMGDVLCPQQLMHNAQHLRRPVLVPGADGRTVVRGVTAAVRVRLPAADPGREAAGPKEMLLFGMSGPGQPWPATLWLTDLLDAQIGTLIRLTALPQRVEHDLAEIADHVGVRDYAGRSFGGWHRHATLSSVAHTVALNNTVDGREFSYAS